MFLMKHSAHRVKLWWKSFRIFGIIFWPSSGDGNSWPLVVYQLGCPGRLVSSRRTKKAIRIQQGRPGLNKDTGLDIPAVILQLVSKDPEGSCDTTWVFTPFGAIKGLLSRKAILRDHECPIMESNAVYWWYFWPCASQYHYGVLAKLKKS